MTNEQYEGLRDTLHNALEEVIINIDENTKKEIKKYTSTLEKELVQQRKKIEQLECIVNNNINSIAKEETVQRLIELLEKLL